MYSQSNEDEIIASIFDRLGVGGKRFVEFGCGKGNQNNTINLLLHGWHGNWYEPRKKVYDAAKKRWDGYNVEIRRRMITPEKVNLVVKDPLDFLSIDIDGNDYWVWKALTARPRLVCIEYDAINGTPFADMAALGEEKGYILTEVSASEVNAFFVRSEDWFLKVSTKAEREGKRPEGYCRLVYDDELGAWYYRKNGKAYRAQDLWFPNEVRYAIDRGPKAPKQDPEFEIYPLELLAHALHCQPVDVVSIIGRYGEFYRRKP